MPVDRSRLPEVGADPSFAFPEIVRHTLSNGLHVRTVEHRKMPVVTCVLVVDGGTGADDAGQEGLAALTADLVDEGTGSLSAVDVSDRLSRIGAQYDADVGADATIFTLTTLARYAVRGASLLADLTIRPSLREPDFTRVRQLRLDRLRQMKDMPSTVAEREFLALLYGNHPYGHLPIGSDSTLRALALDDVTGFHRRQYQPSRATAVIVGDLPHDALLDVVSQTFGGWASDADTLAGGGVSAAVEGHVRRRVAVAPREGAAQSELRIGHLTTGRGTPDYSPLLVMNAVLGGQFVSRVNLKLREEKGFTYGARTGFDWRRGPTPFALSASVHTGATAEAIRDSLAELEGIRAGRPPTDQELKLAKASLTRGYPRNFETAQQVARSVTQLVVYSLPDSYFATFVPKTNAVTTDDVVAAASKHLDPSRLTILVVGDHAVVAESLRSLAPDQEVELLLGS